LTNVPRVLQLAGHGDHKKCGQSLCTLEHNCTLCVHLGLY
jgi:hypothetical protein